MSSDAIADAIAIAMVAGFSLHHDAQEALRRGHDGFAFFRYAVSALVANDARPGRSRLWEEYEELQHRDLPMLGAAGLGIAFRAKPLVKENAAHSISTLGLDGILYLIGVRDKDQQELLK